MTQSFRRTVVAKGEGGGLNISLFAFVLSIIAYLCTLIAFVAAAGSWYGSLNMRMAALETQAARQIAANEANAAALQNLANAMIQLQTLVDERTARVERSAAESRVEIRKNRAEVEALAKTPAKKPKSLATIIGVK